VDPLRGCSDEEFAKVMKSLEENFILTSSLNHDESDTEFYADMAKDVIGQVILYKKNSDFLVFKKFLETCLKVLQKQCGEISISFFTLPVSDIAAKLLKLDSDTIKTLLNDNKLKIENAQKQ
jgi:hypothetical protein